MTRQVPVYHVEYAHKLGGKWNAHIIVVRDPGEADEAVRVRSGDRNYACVKVTGPFDHEVPND